MVAAVSVTVTDADKTKILMLLLQHVKPDGAVWCDGGIPRLRYTAYDELEYLTWSDAAKLVGYKCQNIPNKPIARQQWLRSALIQSARSKKA
jgi:hypothetical protein